MTGGAQARRPASRREPGRNLQSVPNPQPGPTEGPRVVRTRDPARKQRILDAATDLFARNGFHLVSMEEIGTALYATKPIDLVVGLVDELRSRLPGHPGPRLRPAV
jgi:hypothetical protein